MGRRSAAPAAPESFVADIESLDHEGRGIARRDGKVVFVEGALPGERVEAAILRKKPAFEQAQATRILRKSAARTEPGCSFFGLCGGCSLQHMDLPTQVASKQRVLEDSLRHIGKVEPERMLPAIHGPGWGYRHRARLTVRHVPKKGGVLVGFHEKRSSYVADMTSCAVLPPRISDLLPRLRELVGALSIRERLPQIEVAVAAGADVLVLRVLRPPTPEDEAKIRAFAETHRVAIWLQPAGPESAQPFHPPGCDTLEYAIPEFGLRIGFKPTDFTQVNHAINQGLVRRALGLLDPRPGEHIADLFCGLGNFTLPIARSGATVTGIEGHAGLIRRAGENAGRNGLAANTRFLTLDLFAITAGQWRALGPFDKLLIDPPRDGAVELVKQIGSDGPRRIVYVSCNPATLARDAGILAGLQGYRLKAAGIVNMFPHTAHVESVALFERG
jgi:23S rRNA (uracil1939-C5)-methyltransferase